MATASVSECLSAGAILLDLNAADRDGIIRELLGLISDGLAGYSQNELFRAVTDRENKMTTGVGKGVALPHALIPGLDRVYMALGFSRAGVDFRSPDGEATNIAILMLFPQEAHEERIRLLAQISRLLRRQAFREHLASAQTAEAVISLFETTERRLAGDGA